MSGSPAASAGSDLEAKRARALELAAKFSASSGTQQSHTTLNRSDDPSSSSPSSYLGKRRGDDDHDTNGNGADGASKRQANGDGDSPSAVATYGSSTRRTFTGDDSSSSGITTRLQMQSSLYPDEPAAQNLNAYNTQKVLWIAPHRVGLIIGKGGENIKQIQQLTGCSVQVHKDNADSEGNKKVTIMGNTEADIKECERQIDLALTKDRFGGPPGGDSGYQDVRGGTGFREEQSTVQVPKEVVGLVIGRGGETIRALQSRTGAIIKVVKDFSPTDTMRSITLIGGESQREAARTAILEFVTSAGVGRGDGAGGFQGGYGGGGGGRREETITVPSAFVGTIIGRSGETIRKLQDNTGARIQIGKDDGELERKIVLLGLPSQTEHAAKEIYRIVQEKQTTGGAYIHAPDARGYGRPGGDSQGAAPAATYGQAPQQPAQQTYGMPAQTYGAQQSYQQPQYNYGQQTAAADPSQAYSMYGQQQQPAAQQPGYQAAADPYASFYQSLYGGQQQQTQQPASAAAPAASHTSVSPSGHDYSQYQQAGQSQQASQQPAAGQQSAAQGQQQQDYSAYYNSPEYQAYLAAYSQYSQQQQQQPGSQQQPQQQGYQQPGAQGSQQQYSQYYSQHPPQ